MYPKIAKITVVVPVATAMIIGGLQTASTAKKAVGIERNTFIL